jgi:hypothetical protein
MWAQSQGSQGALPSVVPPGYPYGNPAGGPIFLGAYGGQPAVEEPSLKKAKTENGDDTTGNGSDGGGDQNAEI